MVGQLLSNERFAEIERDFTRGGNDFLENAETYVGELINHCRALDWRNRVTVLANGDLAYFIAKQCLEEYRPTVELMMPHGLPYLALDWKYRSDGSCAAKCGELVVACRKLGAHGSFQLEITVGANETICIVPEELSPLIGHSQEYALILLAAIDMKMEAMQR